MVGKLTVLENRTYSTIIFRLWLYPSRPDRFSKAIRIGPGKTMAIDSNYFITNAKDPHHHGDLESKADDDDHCHGALIMVYENGRWRGTSVFPRHFMTNAKVICDRNQNDPVILRGKRANFNFCRLKFLGNIPAIYAKYVGLGMVEEDL